jgi:GT2 family glycosyltransferase
LFRVPDPNDHLEQLNAELDTLRRSLLKLRTQLNMPSPATTRADAIETTHRHVNAIKTYARLLQTDLGELQVRLEQLEREAWDQKVRRADTSAKLKARERLLEQIQESAAWKIVKPIWKLFNRSRKQAQEKVAGPDLAFALDLPKRWTTNRDILLIKGWCFSRNGRQLAGIRAKIGSKSRMGRYGLERADLAEHFAEYPHARQSGFTVEVKVPFGSSTVQLEAIEHGSEWRPFFKGQLRRDRTDDLPEFDEPENGSRVEERIQRLGPLTAAKAHELIEGGLKDYSGRAGAQSPLISILTPTFNSRPEWIAEAALSLLQQTLPDWEWCIVDDGSDNRETRKLLELLSNVGARVAVNSSPGKGISAATNHALDVARGKYVCFLDHDDLLHPAALEALHDKLRLGYDIVYSDEDKLEDVSGRLVDPFFKPDWSPEYFRGAMYVGHLLCVERELAKRIRFNPAFDGVQDFEFMLRLSEAGPKIGHVPRVLYHWRKTPGSIAEKTDAKPQIGLLQQAAVNAHLERMRLPARAEPSELPHRLKVIPTKPARYARVSIIIATRDAPAVLGRCLKSVFEKTSYPNYEVILMDNETTDERALDLMKKYPVRRIPFPNPFNFSRANNEGATAAAGELLVFLNNDTEVIAEDWLQHLAYYAEQPDVGAAGALLAYQDRTVQHAGVALGMRGTADHVMRRFPITADGYAGSLACAREVSVVTGACLMIRKSVFAEIGGFNSHFFTAYQDVDLCLRLRARDRRVILTPRALLLHHEFVSRPSYYYDIIDRMLLLDQWEELIERGDPYYNPNLDLERGDYSPRPV